jgi:hypothetical protein
VDSAGRFVIIENAALDGDYFKDLVLVGRNLYLEFNVFAESDIVHLGLLLVHWLDDQGVGGAILSSDDDDQRLIRQVLAYLVDGARHFVCILN